MIIFSAFIALIIILYFALRTSKAQTWLTKGVAGYLSAKLKTKVEVRGVDIEFFKKVVLEGIYIEDQQCDTLLYLDKLKVGIGGYDTRRHIISFNYIKLQSGKFYLHELKGDSALNLDFIINAFASKDTTPGTSWDIEKSDLDLEDMSFKWNDDNVSRDTTQIDFSHISVTHLQASLHNIQSKNGRLSCAIKNISLYEQCGFILSKLKADSAVFTNKLMHYKNLYVITPHTNLHTDLDFVFKDWGDFSDFNQKVVLKGLLFPSLVSFQDIAFYASPLKGLQNQVSINGDLHGTVSEFRGKKLKIRLGQKTFFGGSLYMKGLPDIDKTLLDIGIDTLYTIKKDIETIPLTPFVSHAHLELPDLLNSLGPVHLKGRLNGYLNNFLVKTRIMTEIGEVETDLRLKNPDKGPLIYSGSITPDNFNLGRLISNEHLLGKVSATIKVEGQGFTKTEANAHCEATINAIEVNRYNYHNLSLNAKFEKQSLSLELACKDPHADVSLSGSVNLQQKLPLYQFNGFVRQAYISRLHLGNRDTSAVLAFDCIGNFSGNQLDNLNGFVTITGLKFSEKGKLYQAHRIALSANNNAAIGKKTLGINSDFIDASLNGEFNAEKLKVSLCNVLGHYIPNFPGKDPHTENQENFYFQFTVKNTQPLTQLFFPDLNISGNVHGDGNFNGYSNQFSCNISADTIRYKKYTFQNLSLNTNTTKGFISFNSSLSKVLLNDSVWIRKPTVGLVSTSRGMDFNLALLHNDSSLLNARLKGSAEVLSGKGLRASITASRLIIDKQEWKFLPDNSLSFDSTAVGVHQLGIFNNNQQIKAEGIYAFSAVDNAKATDENESLIFDFSEFNLSNINNFLNLPGIAFYGVINGRATVYSNAISNKPGINSNLKIEKLAINKDTMGTASIISTWNQQSGLVNLLAYMVKNNSKTFEIKGYYDTSVETENLNFDINLERTTLQPLNYYLKDYVSHIKGNAEASLHLSGTFEKPLVNGDLRLVRTSCYINYLGTTYSLSEEIQVENNSISFSNLSVYDKEGNSATINGKLFHKYFRDWRFDINLTAQHFKMLNTTYAQNNLYYGTAVASGTARFSGKTDNLHLAIKMKSEKGTQINIPLTNAEEIGENDYIRFVKRNPVKELLLKNKNKKISYSNNVSGLQMDFDLDVTPETDFQIIFDSKIGDIIKAKGRGTINMEINTLGDFRMYGDYTIESGDYLFTLQNLINKRFKIERGGTIKWTGSPRDAEINMNAVYKLRLKLDNIGLPGEEYKSPHPIDCRLNLSNRLQNPTINFAISFPDLVQQAQDQVASKIYANSTVNDQFVSLLVLNRFITETTGLTNASATSTGVNTAGTELLSNQVSNWISQLTSQSGFNVGVNYKAANEKNQRDFDVNLQKTLFDDRFTFKGNFGKTYIADNANIVGEFEGDLKVSNKVTLKAFNRLNNNIILSNGQLYTQGVGLIYRQEFDNLKDIWRKKKKKKSP